MALALVAASDAMRDLTVINCDLSRSCMPRNICSHACVARTDIPTMPVDVIPDELAPTSFDLAHVRL